MLSLIHNEPYSINRGVNTGKIHCDAKLLFYRLNQSLLHIPFKVLAFFLRDIHCIFYVFYTFLQSTAFAAYKFSFMQGL